MGSRETEEGDAVLTRHPCRYTIQFSCRAIRAVRLSNRLPDRGACQERACPQGVSSPASMARLGGG